MLNRGFGTSLFNMVPKEKIQAVGLEKCFGTSLFNMVPKVADGSYSWGSVFWN